MTQKEFINHVLINEIEDVVNNHKWLSFILVCAGIEFLGGCIDTKNNLHETGRSTLRFNNAIKTLFPECYQQLLDPSFNLYAQLRCGMNHVTIPGSKIALTEKNSGLQNLTHWQDRVAIVAEDFYNDFKNACIKVVDMIENNEISETFEIQC